MSISLEKRTEEAVNVIVDLGKKAQASGKALSDDVSAAVVLVLDHSISMDYLYDNGTVQDLAERCLALSLTGLDDDGDIQLYFFDSKSYDKEEVNVNNYQGFVEKWHRKHRMSGTDYVGVMQQILKGLKKKSLFNKKKEVPTLVLFITDGEPNSNHAQIEQILRDTSDQPIFWQFMCVGGNARAEAYLDKLNKLPNRKYDNTGLAKMREVARLSDTEFFNKALEEFITEWLPEYQAR